jgi:hypothetical protein
VQIERITPQHACMRAEESSTLSDANYLSLRALQSNLPVDRIGPNMPPAETEATFYSQECLPVEWAESTTDQSELPNLHVARMRTPACPHANPWIYVELRTPTTEAPTGLRFELTEFRVPGRTVRIEGPTVVECP